MGKRKKVENVFPGYVRVGLANRPKLTEFIKAAQGNRTLTQFANECGFSVPTLGRAINEYEKPVSEELISKIFEKADPQITFTLNDLLEVYGMKFLDSSEVAIDVKKQIAGTDNNSSLEIKKLSEEKRKIYEREIENICRLTIQDALLANGYSIFKLEQNQKIGSRDWDLIINTNAFEEDGIKKWYIEIKSGVEVDRFLEELFSSLYLYSDSEEKNKISLVIVDPKAFYVIRNEYEDVEIVDDVSVILVDRMKFKISGEFYFKKKGETSRKQSKLS